ncbi:protein kinase [Amycolatopsis sp. NPDC051128]|uniref:protein kinase domain-containing protein n=1 Tax=Amycolatopsis sp. NPDC051128 TaxID=3155412 RepID=UPI003430995F
MAHEGQLIAARYRLLSAIGRGAAGVVWRAWDERLERVVALKQLAREPVADAAAPFRSVVRAMREARVTARLRHPHAITVHDVVEGDGTPYLVMEYFASRPLTELLEEHGPLDPRRVARLGRQVASALATAHATGVLHRDVSPNNILVAPDGTAKIADFGVSHAMGEGTMTGGGLVVGTPAYLSPEVANGTEAGYPSDVFSLGASLYTAVEGQPPFGVGENPLALLKRVALGEIGAPLNAGPLTAVLERLLRRDPRERPGMADAATLLAAVAEDRTPSPPADPGRAAAPSARRRALTRGAVAGFLVAAGVLVGVSVVPGSGADAGPAVQARATVSSSAAPAPSDVPAASPPVCSARFEVTKSWMGGYQVLVTVRNDGPTPLGAWTVTWKMPGGARVDDLWNGKLVQHGPTVTVVGEKWNATVRAGESTTFGLIAVAKTRLEAMPALACETR